MQIDLDYADYKTINAHKGFTVGFNSDIIQVNNLEMELLKKCEKYLTKAKGVLIKFTINKDTSIVDIRALMEKLNNVIKEDAEIIFGTEIDINLKTEECRFHILLTGLETI